MFDRIVFFCIQLLVRISCKAFTKMHIITITAQAFPLYGTILMVPFSISSKIRVSLKIIFVSCYWFICKIVFSKFAFSYFRKYMPLFYQHNINEATRSGGLAH